MFSFKHPVSINIWSILIVFTTYLLAVDVAAQYTLSGKVTNTVGQPLSSAHVSLSSDQLKTLNMQADSAGAFLFKDLRNHTYVLVASFVGYESVNQIIDLSHDTTINLTLIESKNQLNQVTINAAKPIITASAEKIVYDVKASVTAAGSDALTEMGRIPGVRVSENDINIAGRGSVRVMINGQLIQLSGQALVRYLKGISAGQLGTIELIKNPPASMDAEGNAGLINITTRRNATDGFSSDIQVNGKKMLYQQPLAYPANDYGFINGTADISYRKDKLSFYGSISGDRAHFLEGFETRINYPKQTWIQSDTGVYRYDNFTQTAGIDYKISRRTSVGANYMHEKNNYDGADHVNNPVYNLSGGLDSTFRTLATYYPIAKSNALNLHALTTFDTLGSTLALNADYFHYYRTDRSDFETNSYGPTGLLNPAGQVRYHDTNLQDIHFYTLKADVNKATKFARLSFGAKVSFIDTKSNAFYYKKSENGDSIFDPNLSNEFRYKENTQMAYASLANDYDKWKYSAGLRAEMTQTNGYSYTLNRRTTFHYLRLFPSISVSYQPDKDQTLGFTFNRRINRPTFWNLNPFKSLYTAYSYGEGNPFLQPEYTTNAEVSHTYKNRLISTLFFSFTNNGFTNLTLASPDTNLIFTTPRNFIKTTRFGLTETYSWPVTSWLETTNQLTAYYTSANSEIDIVKDVDGFGAYISSNNGLYFNTARTISGAANFWYQFPEVYRFGRSNAYYKLDLAIKASIMKKALDLTLTVNDIFASSALSFSSNVNNLPQRFTNFQLGRYIQLGISYHIGRSKKKTVNSKAGNEDERDRI